MASRVKKESAITDQQKTKSEEQIRLLQREVDYQTKEFTVELLVQKYQSGLEDDENEIFIPAYQRQFVWNAPRQSKFVESVMLGLPIPYIFISNLPKEISEDEGRAEIVDGSQRIRTLAAFVNDELKLVELEKLDQLNGFRFSDLDLSRQRKFNRQPVRVIELSDKADEQSRRDIFERINTGSDELRDMEKRKGIYTGPFYDFIKDCASREDFKAVCPVSYSKQRREESEELVLRYFAYSDTYLDFRHDVSKFLNDYLKKNQTSFGKAKLLKQFNQMVKFSTDHLPYGFKKNPTSKSVPRVRFEALACGITLALRENPKLKPNPLNTEIWINSQKFNDLVSSDASNSLPRLKGRIEYVRDRLLEI
ncbi:DUF262 domain-containing protein [Polaromonas sp. P5_D5]